MSLLGETLLGHIEKGIEQVENEKTEAEAEAEGCEHTRKQHAVIALFLAKDIALVVTGVLAHKVAMASLKGLRFRETRMFAISRMMPDSWKKASTGATTPGATAETTLADLVRKAGEDPESLDFGSTQIVRVRPRG